MKKIYLIIFLMFIVAIGCGPQGVLYEYQDTEIMFGSRGGFTGQQKEYKLDPSGNLTLTESLSGSLTNLGKIKKSNLKKIYRTLQEIDPSVFSLYEPGNMSYFIRIADSTDIKETVWSTGDKNVPAELQNFYDLLISSMY